jgi:SAM-dependent methyltransferase
MFSKSAQIYDAVYSAKDYAGEAQRLKTFIAEHKRSGGNTLLDIACGTGGHVPYLRDEFAYEGVDLDPQMLAIARERNPGITFHQGDMTDFDLGRQFEVVTCLFSSIGYAGTVEKLGMAIATMARHLLPGGVLLVGPFFPPEAWHVGQPHAIFVDQPNLKIARMNVSGRRDNIALLDFHYLVATPEGIEHFTEHHELGLFTDAEYQHAFTSAGLDVVHDAEGLIGRGLYIGTYPRA